MTTKKAYYSVSSGLSGCYRPDSHFGVFECCTRKELTEMVRDAIEFYDFPKSTFAQANVMKLWGYIKRHGASVAHFNIGHNHTIIAFTGMTKAEYTAAEALVE